MSKDTRERSWETVQIKAFTSWLNGYLEQIKLQIEDIKVDLSDGVRLIRFLELLVQKKVGVKYDENPPSRIQKIQNLHIALKFLEKETDVKLLGIGAEDFADQNLKMILGFFWTLYKKYRIAVIKHKDKSSEEGLLLWCKQTTEGYRDVNIESYRNSFRDGMAMLALVDKFVDSNKEIIDYSQFSKENVHDNLIRAFDLAEKHLGVPKLLEANDVCEGNVDERSLVLYLSLYFHAFVAQQQKKMLEEERRKVEERLRGVEGTLASRNLSAAQLEEENRKLHQELTDIKDKNNYLEERVEVFKQLLEQENLEKEELQKQILKLKEELEKKNQSHDEFKVQMEEQVAALSGQVTTITTKLEEESSARKKENEETASRSKVELLGLGVLKRNLEEHVEDLFRWRKFLDLETESTVDFSGEIRPQIISDISKENFDEQLKYLSQKLEKENAELVDLLKQKESEVKAKKAQEDKKRERQKKSDQ